MRIERKKEKLCRAGEVKADDPVKYIQILMVET